MTQRLKSWAHGLTARACIVSLVFSLVLAGAGATRSAAGSIQAESEPAAGAAKPKEQAAFSLRVVEMGQVIDLGKEQAEWLVATVEIGAPGGDAALLRQVQPLRDQFSLVDGAGNRAECAWLKGGTAADNPAVLRFRAGFAMPPAGVRNVALTVLLPHPVPHRPTEVTFRGSDLNHLPASIGTPAGPLTLNSHAVQPYTPPALPEAGRYAEKGGPSDFRVVQRPLAQGEKQPDRALQIAWRSAAVDLLDRGVEFDGWLVGADGKRYTLLRALLRRTPARGASVDDRTPAISALYWFRVPPKEVVSSGVFTFTLRADPKEHVAVKVENLPVPGR